MSNAPDRYDTLRAREWTARTGRTAAADADPGPADVSRETPLPQATGDRDVLSVAPAASSMVREDAAVAPDEPIVRWVRMRPDAYDIDEVVYDFDPFAAKFT